MFVFASAALGAPVSARTPEYSVTVYSTPTQGRNARPTNFSGGFGLVREQRTLALTRGRNEVRISDVAARIDPTSVGFESITDPQGTRVLDQNFLYDVVGGEKLLQRYIGSSVTAIQVMAGRSTRVTGQLLSASKGLTLRLASGEVRTLTDYVSIDFPDLPGGLVTKPTLQWTINAQRASDHTTQLRYLTKGMRWHADYNLELRTNDKACTVDLRAWATVLNESGASYSDTQLKLVAGNLNLATSVLANFRGLWFHKGKRGVKDVEPAPGFTESELFEYHLYTLGARTDLPNNSSKQIELFPPARAVRCQREWLLTRDSWRLSEQDAAHSWWGAPLDTEPTARIYVPSPAESWISFENKESNQLGLPLPAGRVRMTIASNDGSPVGIGADAIKHTPRSETVRIKLGKAMDLVGERKRIDFTRSDDYSRIDATYEIRVRNHKREAATIRVRESMDQNRGAWAITEENVVHEKRDAHTVDFVLTIPAGGEQKIRYSVRYTR